MLLENKFSLTLVTDGEADVIHGCHMGIGTQGSDFAREMGLNFKNGVGLWTLTAKEQVGESG